MGLSGIESARDITRFSGFDFKWSFGIGCRVYSQIITKKNEWQFRKTGICGSSATEHNLVGKMNSPQYTGNQYSKKWVSSGESARKNTK